MTWQHPIHPVKITDHYGDKEPPRTSPHRGTDYVTTNKGLLEAVNDAQVVDIYWTDCLGWVCAIEIEGSDWVVSYCHLNCHKHGINCTGHNDGTTCMKNLEVGDKVKAGQPVGRQGNSGSCSRGQHCHLVLGKSKRSAVWGKTWDAYKYIQKQIEKNEKAKSKLTKKPKPIKLTPLEKLMRAGVKIGTIWTWAKSKRD